MFDFIDYLVKQIVDNPEAVTIEEESDDNGIVYLIDVAEADRGKIIGKNGKIIYALRNLVNIKAQKENQRVFIKLNF